MVILVGFLKFMLLFVLHTLYKKPKEIQNDLFIGLLDLIRKRQATLHNRVMIYFISDSFIFSQYNPFMQIVLIIVFLL